MADVTDDRDHRRKRDPLHPERSRARTPREGAPIGPPLFGATVGEFDSDDARMAEHFEDDTPVEVLKRIERKLSPAAPSPTVEVDPDAFTPELCNIEWGKRVEARLDACEAESKRLAKWRKAIWGGGAVSVTGIVTVLIWIATRLDARADAAAQERLRIEMLKTHETVLDAFQLWRAAVDVRIDMLERRPFVRRGDTP